jgi:predicted dehydrogenase
MDHELNEELNDEIGALPESDAEILQDAEPKIILPQDRRGFLRTAALAGAGLILPRAIESAQAAAKKPAAKPAVSKTQTAKAKADAKTTTAQKKATVSQEVKQAAQTANPPAKPVQRLNVAIIGAGSQGRNLLLNSLKIPGINFVAVADIWPYSQKYAVNILKKYKQNPTPYIDYQEMLEKEKNLDAVIVATPDWMHAPATIDSLRAGKHVYCEKEMSNTLEGARKMVEAQRETGKLLQIGHQRRSNPRYWHSYELINKEEVLGRMTHFYGQWNRPKRLEQGFPKGQQISDDLLKRYGYDTMERFRNWRWYKQYSGGAIADLGSHQIDIFSWFMRSNPVAVMASGSNDYYQKGEWYDHVMAIYEYEDAKGHKVRGIYQVLNTTGWGGYYEVFMGDEGVLEVSEDTKKGFLVREPGAKPKVWEDEAEKIERMGVNAIALQVGETLNPTGRPKEQKLAAMSEKAPHQLHLENFFNAIREGTPLTCPPDVAYETAVAVLRANDAVAEQKRIEFKKDEFKV